jgi:hypothetical protein
MILLEALGEPHWRRRLAGRVVWVAGGGGLLAAVTALYLEPGFVVTVANQVWGCF